MNFELAAGGAPSVTVLTIERREASMVVMAVVTGDD
jgi:hypothetical protein